MCEEGDFPSRFSCGGSVAFQRSFRLVSRNSFIGNSTADYGGAICLGSDSINFDGSVDSSETSVDGAKAFIGGGLMYFHLSEPPRSLCPAGVLAKNVTALKFGAGCASSAASMSLVHTLLKHVAPGQQFDILIALRDAFNNTVVDADAGVTALLVNSDPSSAVTIRSGVPQDIAKSSFDGIFHFDSFSIEGQSNATAHVVFKAPSVVNHQGVIQAAFKTTGCLPSYFAGAGRDNGTEVSCVLCGAQTYTLDAKDCVSCPERPHQTESHHEEELYSCIAPVDRTEGSLPQWRVAAGFYPVPSLIDPTGVQVCPNHACNEFSCSAHVLSTGTWALDCSACPPEEKHHGEHTDVPNQGHDAAPHVSEDCHCQAGYKDRLCSRCSCNETICYFNSGEPEMRHCTLCRQPSTIVIVVAILALQVSLVVFLLFRRSAIALLMAEAAIAVTLFILGVGEAWMLDLIVMLALLFVITSLSQRLYKKSQSHSAAAFSPPPTDDESHAGSAIDSDSEHDSIREHSDKNHHKHLVAAKTAGIAKITIFFLQSAAATVKPAAWPHWIASVISQLDALNLRVSGIECFAPSLLSNPIIRFSFQLGMPLIVGLNIVLAAFIAAGILQIDPAYRVRWLCYKLKKSRFESKERRRELVPAESESEGFLRIEPDGSSPLLSDAPVMPLPRKPWSLAGLVARVQFSCLFLLSASYFELTNVVLEVLRPCSHGHMASYPWIPCEFSDSNYAGLMFVAIGCVILYTVGIPTFFGLIMFCNRRRILAGDPMMENRYGFLFESYRCASISYQNPDTGPSLIKFSLFRKDVYWWDLVWFLRRVLLSVAVSTLSPLPGYQMALMLSVLLVTLFLHRSFKPFSDAQANMLELAATAVLIFVVVVGSEISQNKRSDKTLMTPVLQNTIWMLIAITTVVLVLSLVLPALRSLIRICKGKLRRE